MNHFQIMKRLQILKFSPIVLYKNDHELSIILQGHIGLFLTTEAD